MIKTSAVQTAAAAQKVLRKFAKSNDALSAQRFFKCAPGEYGEHDCFIGVRVPNTRRVAKNFQSMSLVEIQKLLRSRIHEDRLLSLVILTHRAKKADLNELKIISDFYQINIDHVNNWDLVDVSAEHLLGRYLLSLPENRKMKILKKLASSKNLWHRRIAIMTSFHFIRNHQFEQTLKISEMLLKDPHDLIHKAVGWMLREIGKRDRACAERFLDLHATAMPRTMLRYAIEKFPGRLRLKYLNLPRVQ